MQRENAFNFRDSRGDNSVYSITVWPVFMTRHIWITVQWYSIIAQDCDWWLFVEVPVGVKKPSVIKFPLTAANAVFPAYDMSHLNKWKIYTDPATGRGVGSGEPPSSFMPGLFITSQKALAQHYPSLTLYGDHSFDASPKNEALAAQEHSQDEIY